MKVHYVKAGKDYPSSGITKGQMHYVWTFYRQKPHRQLTPPTRSQLTQDEGLQMVYDAYDGDLPTCADEMDDFVGQIEQARDSFQDRFDNLPEGFQQGDNGQRLENNVSLCEEAISELETIKSEMEEAESSLDALSEAAQEAAREAEIYDFDVKERIGETEPDLE